MSRMHVECWFWATVFLSSFIILVFLKVDFFVTPDDEFVVFNNARLEQFAKQPARYKVIALGDSRLKYASLPDEELASLAARSKADMAFLRIVHNQGQFSDFEPFLDNILRARPDLLILQKPLLTRHRHSQRDLRNLQKFLVWALTDGEGTWNPAGLDQYELQFGTPICGIGARSITSDMSDQQFDAMVSEVKSRGTPDSDGSNTAAARNFVASARQAGVNVVILGLPAMPSYFRIFAEAFPDYVAAEVKIDAESWEYPGQFPADNYCDMIHLDANARVVLSGWLASQAIKKLEQREKSVKLARNRSETEIE